MARRQQKTRKAVFAAFEELVSEKRYEQITVQDMWRYQKELVLPCGGN